jgi:hypothetical protein
VGSSGVPPGGMGRAAALGRRAFRKGVSGVKGNTRRRDHQASSSSTGHEQA